MNYPIYYLLCKELPQPFPLLSRKEVIAHQNVLRKRVAIVDIERRLGDVEATLKRRSDDFVTTKTLKRP